MSLKELIEKELTQKMNESWSILGMAVQQSIAENPKMTEIDDSFRAKVAEQPNSTIKTTATWMMVNVGLDDKGNVQAEIGMGGSVVPLMMLRDFVTTTINKKLAEAGACGCPDCTVQALMEMEDQVHAEEEACQDGKVH